MATVVAEKPHVVCFPVPAQGHITPMVKVAKILHSKGFHVTFVNTEDNHRRLLRSQGSAALPPDFHFEAIPNNDPSASGIPDVSSLNISSLNNCLTPFRHLLSRLNGPSSQSPPVTFVIADSLLTFTIDVAEELGIPAVCFWPGSACCLLCLAHFQHLIDRGIVPLKSMDDYSNGYLDTEIDWLPGLDGISLRHLPSWAMTLDITNDPMFSFLRDAMSRFPRASCFLINTFDEFENAVLDGLSSILPSLYTIGPVHMLSDRMAPPESSRLDSISSSLLKEQAECLEWLQGRKPGSVLYVNFGSLVVMSNEQLIEIVWGLANSEHDFLMIIRPDLVMGESPVLPRELLNAIEGRSFLADWCPQEQVLRHTAIGGFLNHCGWNSILESIGSGVPMLGWPFYGDNLTNCHHLCAKLGVCMEIDSDVKREKVEALVRELMEGEKGKEMRNKALEWKEAAFRAIQEDGTSFQNIDKMVKKLLLLANKKTM